MGLSGGKTFCLWMIILGGLAVLTGSAAPYWLTVEFLVGKSTCGMWFYCTETAVTSNECELYEWSSLNFDDFTLWFYGVHAGTGLASLIVIIVLFVALGKVCGESDAATGVGVWALIGGFLGIGAAVTFYFKTYNALLTAVVLGFEYNRDWAFIVFAAGSSVIAFFSVVLLALPSSPNSVQPF